MEQTRAAMWLSQPLRILNALRVLIHVISFIWMVILRLIRNRSTSLNNLANELQTQFEQLGDPNSLAEAIEPNRLALTLRPQGHPDPSSSLTNLAGALQIRFEQLGDLDSLAEVEALHRQALSLRPLGHPDRASSLSNLANALQNQFEHLGDLHLLAGAVELHRQALDLFPRGHADRSASLNNLANALQTQFEQLGDLESLAESVDLHRQALIMRPLGHPDRSLSLNNLANTLWTIFEQVGDRESLAEAVDMHRQALDLRPPGHPDRLMSLSNLANALYTRFEHLGGLDTLAEAIYLHRQELDLNPQGHPNYSSCLSNLANALSTRFEQLRDLDSLAEAINLHKKALDLHPPGHPNRSSSLHNLSNTLQNRFEQLGDLDSLAEAVNLRRQALDLHPRGHPHHSLSLKSLASSLQSQFEQLGDLNLLAEAVNLRRRALDLHPQGHPHRSDSLNNLANALQIQFEQLGDLKSLAEAVDLHRQALNLRPPGHSARSMSLSNLANALLTRFNQLGKFDMLAEAVELHRQALDLCPQEDPNRSSSLNNLANTLHTRFEQLGDLDYLADAIDLHRKALNMSPPGHPARSMSLNNLADALRTRFEQLDDLDALAEAVVLNREALALRPPGHPGRSLSLNNLANVLETRFEQLGGLDTLAEAVDLHRQALNLRPQGHPLRSSSLNNLANALKTRFQQLSDLDSLAEAVELHRQALDLRPQGHCHRSQSLANLANALGWQSCTPSGVSNVSVGTSSIEGRKAALDESLSLYREGLLLCTHGHPDRMNFLFDTGMCMLQPSSHVHNFEEGIRHILEALYDPASTPQKAVGYSTRVLPLIEASYRYSLEQTNNQHSQDHHHTLLLEAYTQVIRLLPRAASLGLDHVGRLRALSGAESISRNAATRAVAAGRITEAVEMLEEGRGVFWSQALRLRTTDLDRLPIQDAQELRRLFQTLGTGSVRDEAMSKLQLEQHIEEHRRLSNAAEALIADIRARHGMSRFLLPPEFSSLVQSLPEGFVVFLNVSELGHHALIMNGSTKAVHSLPLRLPARIVGKIRMAVKDKSSHTRDIHDALSEGDMEQSLAEQFRAGVRERATFGDSLADLWVCIVKPIIDLLQLKKSSGRNRPRLWWCATHNLTFLPIHAAGGYTRAARERSGAGDDCASDYIVSSYITSISALLRARNGFSTMARSDVKGLLLHEGNPGRGWSSIGNVKHEVSRVQERFNAAGASLTLVRPSLPGAITYLKETHMHILHLACHGAQKDNPLASGFILRDEDLTIQDIMQLDLKHASLAFLSACQTAKGKRDQPDEGVHLAASMLFCGFKSVIATMWGMSDKDGPIIADYVYDALFKGAVFDLNLVPYALDDAVRHLREQEVDAERWSVFVHMGA